MQPWCDVMCNNRLVEISSTPQAPANASAVPSLFQGRSAAQACSIGSGCRLDAELAMLFYMVLAVIL
jgi:hypothetical protein